MVGSIGSSSSDALTPARPAARGLSSASLTRLDPRLPTSPEEILRSILDPTLRGDDLYPLLHQLRTAAPIFKTENTAFQLAWVITRFEDDDTVVRAKTLSSDSRVLDIFATGTAGTESEFFRMMKRLMKFLDPPEHARVRALVSRAFTPRAVERLRPRIGEIVSELLAARRDAGRLDVIADFAFPLPIIVICEMLGVPVEDVPLFFQWSEDFARRGDVGALTPERERRGEEATRGLTDYFLRLIDERRRTPRGDLLSDLIRVEDERGRLGELELVATGILLLQAGHETTANLIGKAVLALLRHPDELARFRADPGLDEAACEEFLRYDTSVQITPKVATVDLPYHDRTIRAGETVATFRGAVNRDPARYADPDRLDLSRRDGRHHSFGVGAYHCLGASLARAEIQIAMRGLMDGLPAFELVTERPRYKPSLYLHGLESLEIGW
ncbi:MAG: cytochrome P450 [Spirochaetaceae bacterium]|nr:cytochrome P450 [Myxococcales bacterium]MCB9725699.1 cytochrome P450 [Spirochaetaceae bacterium]HPG26360.1 cytochrome P450 [Myxococcota bacterium]